MKDKNFDLLLQDSLPELPPDDIVTKVNPWKKFICFILIGLILNTQTISYFNLPYIMPIVGNIFLLLGFQALRKENRFFKIGWIFTCLHFVLTPIMKLNISLYQQKNASAASLIIVFLLGVCFYSLFRCLALGVTALQEKCGLKSNHKVQRTILGCSSVLIFLNLISRETIWINALVVGSYIVLIWNIIVLIGDIKETGYSIQIAPIVFSDKAVILISILLILSGYAIGEFFLSSASMNQMEWQVSNSADVTDVKDHLEELGFPGHILDSMLDDDILACKNAKKVIVVKTEHSSDNPDIPKEYTAYDIAVEFSDKERHWKLFHYFEWTDEMKFYNSDCIVLWPVSRGYGKAWEIVSEYTGQILYNIDRNMYRASFDDIEQTNFYNPATGGYNGDPEIIIEFTFPKDGKQKRGYVSYDAVAEDLYNVNLNSWVTYIHQSSRFLYPVETSAKHWKNRYQSEGKNQDNFLMFETSIHYNMMTGD